MRKLDSGSLGKLRAAVTGETWPLRTQALFNPVPLTLDPSNVGELAPDYLIAACGDGGDTGWIRLANEAVLADLIDYLPEYGRAQVMGALRRAFPA